MKNAQTKEAMTIEVARYLHDLNSKVHTMVEVIEHLNGLLNSWTNRLLEVRRSQQDGMWDPEDLDACCTTVSELQGRLRDILLEMRAVLVVSSNVVERYFVMPDQVQADLEGSLEMLRNPSGEVDVADLEHERLLRMPPKKALVQIGRRIAELCDRVRKIGDLLAIRTQLECERIRYELIADREDREGESGSV